ncbi:MAG: hypothetical protein GWN62_02340 [Aliifodinibius sp.]|nr:hypothetical protein [Fodinibius sp.]
MVFKQNETYILDGESPDDFMIYPVSNKVGCPAPLTLDTAEIGFELAENVQRNVAIWISHSGPIMFDGAVISPLKGIDTYFDPNSDDCINFDYITNARGWVDSTYREYNLLIPTGNETDPNVWLVYDLTRKRWYKKDTGTSNMPICGFPVFSEEGNQYIYGGLTTGYMMRLENGTDWDGANIQQRVETGDFWPTGNIWQQTLIRRLKIVTKKIVESATLEVLYYRDTDLEVGENVTFRDGDVVFTDGDVAWSSPTTITLDISLAGSTERLARDTEPLNKLGWSHRFAFILETNSTTNGFRPIYWGIQYVYARDDLGTES